ncbi:MAG TPA: ATP-binding cassette domain-containing protein [Actinobacteria bacterium]|nr:ATP-binding cassette domain-containing protein [Actinomycetota bacterium]
MSERPAVVAEAITKRFGDLVALDDVDLCVEPGTIYGLLGPNGAGKTTLIRVLTTLLRPEAGRAEVAGVDVLAEPHEARRHLGLAGQFAAVDDYLTGRENVEMIGRLYGLDRAEARRRTGELLERIGLDDAADRTVRTYSGGMRRRLDLAASMVGEPEVLFLDEPTTGIDPKSRIDIWLLIQDLVARGTTILLTTQYLDEADRLADRLAVVDHGKVISEGTPDELKARLGGSVIEISVRDDDRARLLELLASMGPDEPKIDPVGGSITIPAPEGSRSLTEVVLALDEAGIVPDDIGLRKPTLDDVFLALTGHVAEEVTVATELGPPARRGIFGRRTR